jgi:hypothetical protein
MQPRARHSQPVPLADLVARAVHRQGWSRASAHAHVLECWERILPPTWRERCRAVAYRAGKLTVAVDSSPLLEELRGFKSLEMLRLLNDALRMSGRLPIVEVRALDFRRS